jgi:hypothetical protein
MFKISIPSSVYLVEIRKRNQAAANSRNRLWAPKVRTKLPLSLAQSLKSFQTQYISIISRYQMPRVLQKLAVIALLTLTVMLLIFKPSFNFSFRPPPEPTHQSGLRWFHPKGFPSVDEWEDRLRGQKIFLGPSYILQVPNPSVSLYVHFKLPKC